MKRSLVQLLLCIVDLDYRLLLSISLRYFVHSGALFLTVFGLPDTCEGLGLGLGLEVQSLGLGLDQEGLVLVLVLGNFWSLGLGLGLGLETKVLVLVLKKNAYIRL